MKLKRRMRQERIETTFQLRKASTQKLRIETLNMFYSCFILFNHQRCGTSNFFKDAFVDELVFFKVPQNACPITAQVEQHVVHVQLLRPFANGFYQLVEHDKHSTGSSTGAADSFKYKMEILGFSLSI